MAGLHRLRDLLIRFLGRSLEQLADQVACLLASEMATMDVGADDKGVGVNVGGQLLEI
jgi:hypothetical protein